MKRFVLCSMLLASLSCSAQFLQDNVSGQPYLAKALDEYQGSPLLFPSWAKADVKASNGKIYNGMLVNVDLMQELPLFMRDGKVYTFSDNVNEFTITDSIRTVKFRKGKLIDASLPDALLEVISDTPLVVKKHERTLVESVGYDNSNKSYRYTDGKSYYAKVNGAYKKITLNEDNAKDVFGKKWDAVKDYAKKNKISFKTEAGWRQLIAFSAMK